MFVRRKIKYARISDLAEKNAWINRVFDPNIGQSINDMGKEVIYHEKPKKIMPVFRIL